MGVQIGYHAQFGRSIGVEYVQVEPAIAIDVADDGQAVAGASGPFLGFRFGFVRMGLVILSGIVLTGPLLGGLARLALVVLLAFVLFPGLGLGFDQAGRRVALEPG